MAGGRSRTGRGCRGFDRAISGSAPLAGEGGVAGMGRRRVELAVRVHPSGAGAERLHCGRFALLGNGTGAEADRRGRQMIQCAAAGLLGGLTTAAAAASRISAA